MEAKRSVAAAEAWEGMNQVRRINVIYFLSRMGRIEHPHLIRVHHFSRNGVHLRDVKRWLSDLRGKDMPDSFSWSYKRRYKKSYVWQDMVDDDLITPISDNEYVLKGSEIYSVPFGLSDVRPCGEKKVSTEKPERNPENPEKKMEVSTKTSEEIEIVTVEESSEPFESETSTTTDESMKSNARKPEKDETNSEKKKDTEKNKPPLTHSASFSKSKSHSSGTSHLFRSLLTCGVVDTNESAIMTINRVNKTSKNASNEARYCKTETMGGSQRILGNAWDQQSRQQNSRKSFTGVKTPKSRNATQKKISLASEPIVEPNCSQCGKAFKPEKLHSHMKSCKGMKSLNKIGGGGAATIAPGKTSSRRSTGASKKDKFRWPERPREG